jgi:hypothetical protein
MILLKDGTFTQDPRLTRIKQFDERSRAFKATAGIETKKPRSYTWSCSKHLDQGNEGACVGFGWTHELIARPSVVTGLDATFAREKVYFEAQKIDEWPGGAYPGAYPKYEGTSVLSGAKVVKQLGYIKEYRWAFGLDDLILAVGYKGPAVIGVNWYDGMFDTDQNGYIYPTGQVSGGHCLLVKGVNVTGRYFMLHNSWGPSWGVNGDAKITFNGMDLLLRQGGEACIPVTRSGTGFLTNIFDSLKDLFTVK